MRPGPQNPSDIRRIPSAAWFLVGCAAVAALYIRVVGWGWAWDDYFLLSFVERNSPFDYFFVPATYGNSILFCPLQYPLYEFTWNVVGLEPVALRLVQVGGACALFVATYSLLLRWISNGWAFAGAVLAMVSAPVATIVALPMNVHYLHGLILVVLALHCLHEAQRRRSTLWAVLGAVCFLLSMLAKEIYAPLVLPLAGWVAVGRGSAGRRARLRSALPFFVAAAIYAVWRSLMLKHPSGGLDAFLEPSTWLDLPLDALQDTLGNGVLFWTTLGLLATPLVVRTASDRTTPEEPSPLRRDVVVIAVSTLFALAFPLVPIAERTDYGERALSLFAWAGAVTWILLLARSSSPTVRRFSAACAALLIAVSAVRASDWLEDLGRTTQEMAARADFLLSGSPADFLYSEGGSRTPADALRLRRQMGRGDGPRHLIDPIQIRPSALGGGRVFEYQAASERLVDITGRWPDLHRRALDTPERALRIELRPTELGTEWSFGPYIGRGYTVVPFNAAPTTYRNLPPRGLYRAPLPEMDFVIRYRSVEGWITYSDQLHWSGPGDPGLFWERTTGPPAR